MYIKDLIQELEKFDPDMEVMFFDKFGGEFVEPLKIDEYVSVNNKETFVGILLDDH
jgi:hypothetical protein